MHKTPHPFKHLQPRLIFQPRNKPESRRLPLLQEATANAAAAVQAATLTAAQLTSAAATANAAATLTAAQRANHWPMCTRRMAPRPTASNHSWIAKALKLDLIAMGNVLGTNFSQYKAAIIGYETGNGSSWGDNAGQQANHIVNSGTAILGVGEGGYAYLGKLSLLIGYPNGAHGSSKKSVYAVDANSPCGNPQQPELA